MIGNCSDVSYIVDERNDIYHADKKTRFNASEVSPLAQDIRGVTNNTEKIDHVIYLHSDEKTEAQPGLLKRLLVGAFILTGSVLATGFGYIVGRMGAGCHSEKGNTLHLIAPPTIATTISSTQYNSSILLLNSQQVAVNTTFTPEISVSPYSYYEDIYGNTVTRNNIQESTTRYDIAKKNEIAIKEYRHENERDIYYNNVPMDKYFPLGRKLYNQLAYFCSSELQLIVADAYKSDPESRCRLLGKMVYKIDECKFYEALLRDKNIRKETLSAGEHAEEIMARRKLTAAYLAAECIMERKELGEFYITAMADNKNYSAEELIEKDKRIMNYFSTHYEMGECLSPGNMISV